MADGTTKAIKDVEVGDEVVATDPETGETSAQPVTDLHVNLDRELTTLTLASLSVLGLRTIGEGEGDRSTRGPTEAAVSTLETTQNHPFWDVAADEWVDAADLVPGRSVVTSPTGELQLVVAVDNYTGAAEMRDLTVANIHTYYVLAGTAPVLVHNNNNDCEVDVYHAVPDDSVADSVLAGIDWERLNPNSRFGRALYVASRPETAVAEVRHHKGNPALGT